MAAQTLAMIVFLFPLAWSPGPGNLFFAAIGARSGVLASLPASGGYHLATFAVTVAIAFGFAAFSAFAPLLVAAVKLAGAFYVFWLAFKLSRAERAGTSDAVAAGFRDGVMLLVLNPKAYLIIGLLLSQFGGRDGMQASAQWLVWIALVFTLNNFVAFLAWTIAGDRLRRAFYSRANARNTNRFFAVVLALVGVWMLMT